MGQKQSCCLTLDWGAFVCFGIGQLCFRHRTAFFDIGRLGGERPWCIARVGELFPSYIVLTLGELFLDIGEIFFDVRWREERQQGPWCMFHLAGVLLVIGQFMFPHAMYPMGPPGPPDGRLRRTCLSPRHFRGPCGPCGALAIMRPRRSAGAQHRASRCCCPCRRRSRNVATCALCAHRRLRGGSVPAVGGR